MRRLLDLLFEFGDQIVQGFNPFRVGQEAFDLLQVFDGLGKVPLVDIAAPGHLQIFRIARLDFPRPLEVRQGLVDAVEAKEDQAGVIGGIRIPGSSSSVFW